MALMPCPDCGNEVSSTAAACPKCGHAFIPCPYCAKAITPSASRCHWCGNSLEAPSQAQPKPQPKPVDPKTALGCGTIIALVLVVGMISQCGKSSSKVETASAPVAKEVVYNSPWDGSVRQVERWLKGNLKDPNSFEAIEWSPVVKKPEGFVVRCKYRAKNSFGGYVVEERIFQLDPQGEVVSSVDLHGK